MKVTHDKAGGQRKINNNQGQHVDQRLNFYEVITDFLTNIIGYHSKWDFFTFLILLLISSKKASKTQFGIQFF